MPDQPDLTRLRSVLMTSGLQTRDNPTFQVINRLIDATKQIQEILSGDLSTIGGSSFLTVNNDTGVLVNSRREVAGLGITFNDAVPGVRTLNVTPLAIGDTVTSGTDGSVLFIHPSGILAQDNAQFFWDDTTFQLLIGGTPLFTPNTDSFAIGNLAAAFSTNSPESVYFGSNAGAISDTSPDSVFIGFNAGYNAIACEQAVFLGWFTGYTANTCGGSLFVGPNTGNGAAGCPHVVAIGFGAAGAIANAADSIFLGTEAGLAASSGAANVIFIGKEAGNSDPVNNTGGDFSSILIGNYTLTGGFSDSIAIGQGTMNSAVQQFNIGNVIYGLNIYNGTTPSSTPIVGGLVGIGKDIPTDILDILWDHDGFTNINVSNPNSGASAGSGFNMNSDVAIISNFVLSTNSIGFGGVPAGPAEGLYGIGGPVIIYSDGNIIIFCVGTGAEFARIDTSSNGIFSIGTVAAPTASVHIKAGSTTAGTSPIKLTSGPVNTTGELGAIEYNGTNLSFVRTGVLRESIWCGNGGAAAPGTNLIGVVVDYYGTSATRVLTTPNSWASVVIAGTTYKIPLYT